MNWEVGIDIYALLILCVNKITDENLGLPRWLSGKQSACNAGDLGLIPGMQDSDTEATLNRDWNCPGQISFP